MIDQGLVDYLQEFSFRSNANLRPKGTTIAYTEDMVNELIKCKNDPVYFISNYVKVVHPDRGIVLMELYEYQERMVRTYHDNRRVIFLTARQQGKTTVSAAYFVWYVLFNDNKSVAIMANKQATAFEIMDRFRLAYENLPKWMQQGVETWNRGSVALENGSKVFGAATTSSGVRGKTCVAGETEVTVRNKITGEIRTLPIGEFTKKINNTTKANSPIGETENDIWVHIHDN